MRTKEILTAVLLPAVIFMMSGRTVSAQKYDGLIDKTVALVGNSMILLSQVESEAMYMQSMGYVSW